MRKARAGPLGPMAQGLTLPSSSESHHISSHHPLHPSHL